MTEDGADHQASAALLQRAKRVTPGGINSSARAQLMTDSDGDPICFDRARGAELHDIEGTRYIDYLNAWGPIVLGHCDPIVNDAVASAIESLDLTGLSTSKLEVRAAELVQDRVPCADKVQFGVTGSEVVAHAIRLARAHTGRRKVVKFQGNYHGWYDPVALNYLSRRDAVGEQDVFTRGLLDEATAETIVLPYNDLDAIEATFDENGDEIACVILEPVAHDMGCVPPADGFLEGLRAVTATYGSVLIFDEIVTGGRHGIQGVQGREGVTPDLTTMSKAVANGHPVSLLCGTDEYMTEFDLEDQGESVYFAGTYNGHTGGMAAVVETITQLEDREVQSRFDEVRGRIVPAVRDHIEDTGADAFVTEYGGAYSTYFGDEPLRDYRDVLDLDIERFVEYRWELVDRGILMVPMFPRAAMLNASLTDDHVTETIEAAGEAMRTVSD